MHVIPKIHCDAAIFLINSLPDVMPPNRRKVHNITLLHFARNRSRPAPRREVRKVLLLMLLLHIQVKRRPIYFSSIWVWPDLVRPPVLCCLKGCCTISSGAQSETFMWWKKMKLLFTRNNDEDVFIMILVKRSARPFICLTRRSKSATSFSPHTHKHKHTHEEKVK